MVTFMKFTTIFLGLVSGYTTWQGLRFANRLAENILQREIMPMVVAIATYLISMAFWLSLFQWYSRMQPVERHKINRVAIPIISVFIFFASTIWSIIGIGGIPAMTYHMSATVDEAKTTLDELVGQVEKENSLKMTLDALSEQFSTLSRLESDRGAYSSYTGRGSVTIQLQSISETLRNISQLIGDVSIKRRGDINMANDAISNLRSIVDDPKLDLSSKIIQFSNRLTEVNQLFQKISSSGITNLVHELSNQLNSLSVLGGPTGDSPLAKSQKEALTNLNQTVAIAKEVIGKFTEEIKYGQKVEIENLSTLSFGMAVILYFYTIIPEIAIAIALDFAPVVLLLILVWTQRVRDEEEKEKMKMELHQEM